MNVHSNSIKVNLPARLVVLKNTFMYNMGKIEDYSEAQVLQMIGRAGRPQFDDQGEGCAKKLNDHVESDGNYYYFILDANIREDITRNLYFKVSLLFSSLSLIHALYLSLSLLLLVGTAVILTRHSSKAKYEALVSGLEAIESSLHANLIEHLNAEVVLQTITNGEKGTRERDRERQRERD